MTEYVHIEYKGSSVSFSEKSLTELVKTLLSGCKTIRTSTGQEIPAEHSSLGLLARLFYNNGNGETLFFSVPSISIPVVGNYKFGVYAGPADNGLCLVISVSDYFITNKRIGKKVSMDLIRRSKAVYDLVQPEYAIGDWEEVVDKRGENKREVFWINFYGPELVKKIGREKLATIPHETIEKIEDLANGGVMLLRGITPDKNSEHKEAVRKHLFGK